MSNIIKNYNKVVGEIGRLEIEIADLKSVIKRIEQQIDCAECGCDFINTVKAILKQKD